MDPALVNLGWTEEHWNRICSAVTEEAQKARVAAQILPTVGPEAPTTLALPNYSLSYPPSAGSGNRATRRLVTNSDPELYLTRISVNLELRSHEAADPTLSAALSMFRRAANVIARVEDALIFYGRRRAKQGSPFSSRLNAPRLKLVPAIYDHTNDAHNVPGIFPWVMGPTSEGDSNPIALGSLLPATLPLKVSPLQAPGALGDGVVNAIIAAISTIEGSGYPGPFACVLGDKLFEALCTPAPTLVLPRDRVLPFLQGPLMRSSALAVNEGVIISLAGSAVELVVASDLKPRFMQQTQHGKFAFRIAEKVALRVRDTSAIQWINK